MPPLTIDGSTIESTVTYDSARRVYIYAYTVVAAASNRTGITGFSIDIAGRESRTQLDPDLQNNFDREETVRRQLQPQTAIPVGITVPHPWVVARVNGVSRVAFVFMGAGNDLEPGERLEGFRLESKLPPAWRAATIDVSSKPWIPILRSYPKGADVEFNHTPSEFELQTKVLAPFDLDETTWFVGGGQSPREVNPFLRFESPTESRVTLPATTTRFETIVVFGATTDPTSFTADLNGVDVTNLFRPMPGVTDSVVIPLVAGTNKPQLSIQGETSSGRSATDSDTLTFIVK
ncbi:MAG: hypothetical protein ACYC7A_14975 [Thermoanaerobaculia bacterium]